MNGERVFDCWVDPRLDDFDDKQAVLGHHAGVYDAALKVGVALVDKRGGNDLCRFRGEAELSNLSIFSPVELSQRTTASPMSTVGMLITHSLLALSKLNK